MPPTTTTTAIHRFAGLSRLVWAKKIMLIVVVSVLMGWLYDWASPRAYPTNSRVGFGYGVAHGAMMPLALPSLVLGRDVEIFATHNSGRGYKLGYIVGINLCGLIFFGSAFWRPGRAVRATSSGKSQ